MLTVRHDNVSVMFMRYHVSPNPTKAPSVLVQPKAVRMPEAPEIPEESPDIWSCAVSLLKGMSDLGCACCRSTSSLFELDPCAVLHAHLHSFNVIQAHNKVPDDAWEYHTRKALNDAAYKGLDYVPYCSTMPVQPQTDEPKFMWVRGTMNAMQQSNKYSL